MSCVSGVRTTTRRISKEVKVDVKQFPTLVWRGKVMTLPEGGDARRKETDDQAGRIYVAFPRFPTALRIIGDVGDTTAPVRTIVKSKNGSAVTHVVVRSGETDLGRWCLETGNGSGDYKQVYGTEPAEELRMVCRSSAELYMGAIFVRRP